MNIPAHDRKKHNCEILLNDSCSSGEKRWAGGWPASHHPQQDPCWCLASRGGEGHHPGAQREHGLQQAVWGGALSLSGTTLQDTKVLHLQAGTQVQSCPGNTCSFTPAPPSRIPKFSISKLGPKYRAVQVTKRLVTPAPPSTLSPSWVLSTQLSR